MKIYTDKMTAAVAAAETEKEPKPCPLDAATVRKPLADYLEAHGPMDRADAITWVINWAYKSGGGLILGAIEAAEIVDALMTLWHAPKEP